MEDFSSVSNLWVWWTSNGPDLANGAIVLSAIAAFRIISSSKNVAKRKATINMLQQAENNSALVENKKNYIELKKNSDLATYGTEAKKGSAEAGCIRIMLNHFELMAVAVTEKIADEELYKRWNYTTITSNYEVSKGYITAVRARNNAPNLYIEFEKLALRWNNKPLNGKLKWYHHLWRWCKG